MVPLALKHGVLAGFFGSYPARGKGWDWELPLISNRRHNAARYLPASGNTPKRGPTPGAGDKLAARCQTRPDGQLCRARHKDFPPPFNVLGLVNTKQRPHNPAPVVGFSTDLSLAAPPIVDDYCLRVPLAFNVRPPCPTGLALAGLEERRPHCRAPCWQPLMSHRQPVRRLAPVSAPAPPANAASLTSKPTGARPVTGLKLLHDCPIRAMTI